MIVSTPLLTTLAAGTERRTIEFGDNEPTVPSSLLVTIPAQHQTIIVNAGTDVERFSGLTTNEVSRTNQAALITTMMTLSPGLWEIYISLTNAFNWAHVIGTAAGEVEVELSIGSVPDLLTLVSDFASIGQHAPIERRYRFMFISQFTVRHILSLTGVGQTTDSMCVLNAVKLL